MELIDYNIFNCRKFISTMASGELSLTSNSSQEGSHEFSCYQNDRQRKTSNDSPNTYETMKHHYDQAMIELNSLRSLQSDGKMQMDRVTEQLEYYRNQYLSAMDQVSQSSLEHADISNENVRLQQRIHHLEKKLTRQEKENGNSAHAFAEQYNDLKKKLENNRVEYDKLSKETDVCKKVCSDLSRDRTSLTLEKDDLKQQLANTIAQLEAAIRDNSGWREKWDKLVQQHDNYIKEMTQVLQARADELRRVTSQRNAAEHELRTILNERKGVLEENQKLSDDLTTAKDELEKTYNNNKSLVYENDRLKREIDTVLRHRDNLMNECANMREKFEEANNKLEKIEGRENWGKGLTDSKDQFGYNDQHNLDLEAANKEAEKLRKNLERARAEIEKAAQETEVAKSSRDLAISEREKIVQERDSVKSLCDELRKERDKAISDRLAEIRDSEKIKKQKDEACREIEQLREQLESQLSSSLRNIRWSYMPYDLEQSTKFDREIIELNMSGAQQNDDLGIMLEGGREDSQNRIDSGIVVVGLSNHSAAAGKLRINDCIVQVNNLDCTSVTKRIVIEAIRNGGPQCEVTVKRQRMNKAHMYAAQLSANDGRPHGISLEIGVFISKIATNSLAAKEDELAAGDRVLSINNKTMEGITLAKDAMLYLDNPRNETISIIALKQITQANDIANSARSKHNRMINTCTQTIEQFNVDVDANRNISSNNSKSTSKISEMFNKFRGKIHMQKGSTASESDSLCQEHDAIAVLDSVLNNENSSNSGKSKDNLFKRSKRSKKDSTKEANKNLGTWPRANLINTSTTHENHTGTIVQHRKKERPALSLFTGPITLGKEEKPQPTKKNNYFSPHMHETTPSNNSKPITSNGSASSGGTNNSNRNSNPIPFHVLYPPPSSSTLHRHSVYSTLEAEPIMLESGKALPSKNSDMKHYQHHHHHHQHHHHNPNSNRYSLNFTPTSDSSHLYNSTLTRKSPTVNMEPKFSMQQSSLDYVPLKNSADSFLNSKSPMSSLDFKTSSSQHYQYQQQQQDLISLKSQNSIDSYLSPKSPPSMDVLTKPSPRDTIDMYVTKRLSKNVSKYPSDSDSLGMESITSPNNTLPSCVVMRGSQMTSSAGTTSTRTQRLFPAIPNHLHSSTHSNRQISPLTTPMTQSIDMGGGSLADKLEYDFNMSTHHSHGASMDIETYGRSNKVHPIRDRDIIYGSYGHAYEGGTFPRKKENQRFRVPSNPSVTSKGSDVKNSTGSIEQHGSEHGSPMPPSYKVEILSHGVNKRNSIPDYGPTPGVVRRVTIDKSTEPLGITIQCNSNGGGIFVSTVKSNSIASQVRISKRDRKAIIFNRIMSDFRSVYK